MRPYFLKRVWKGSKNCTRQKYSANIVEGKLGNCRGGGGLSEIAESLALQGLGAKHGWGSCSTGLGAGNGGFPCGARDARKRVAPPTRVTYRKKWMGRGKSVPTLFSVYELLKLQPPTKAEPIRLNALCYKEIHGFSTPYTPPTKSGLCPTAGATAGPTTNPTGKR